MSVNILPILFLAFSAVAANRLYEGVDPNTLSCDPRGQVFLLLPHFTDCSKFFMCANGKEVEFSCSANLIFDFGLQTCNWPRATKCILRKGKEEEDIEGSGEDEFDLLMEKYEGRVDSITAETVVNSVRPLSMDASGRSHQFKPNLNCLWAESAAKRVPYKSDCQRYWRCINGVPQAAYCTDGLFFNEKTQQCDFEANVKCLVETEDELKSEFILYK